jgi:hypothetical protein
MHDIRPNLERTARDVCARGNVAQAELSAHGDASQSEREMWREASEALLGIGSAGRSIRHNADAVPLRVLATHEVEHVAEKPSHRRAQHMQNIEAAGGRFRAARRPGRYLVFTLR